MKLYFSPGACSLINSRRVKYVALHLSDLKHLQNCRTRVAARPAVREAMKAEGLLA